MRLLLDEHLSPGIARRLRDRGHDVVAVAERPDLKGRPDWLHFASLPAERRAIVTCDLGDFRPLLAAAVRAGVETFGIVCVSHRFPVSAAGIGRLVRSLEAFLLAHPGDTDLIRNGGEFWLDELPGTD